MLIKCKFLKDNAPAGREYTYRANMSVKVGDLVQINSSAKGIVTAVDVPEEEVAAFADKIKNIQGLIESDIILKNWCVVNAVSQQIQLPKYFRGSIYGHPVLKDGYLRTTSPTVEILDCGDYKVIVTVTGSRYRIYPEDVAPEAEAAYPGYYNRLNMEGK